MGSLTRCLLARPAGPPRSWQLRPAGPLPPGDGCPAIQSDGEDPTEHGLGPPGGAVAGRPLSGDPTSSPSGQQPCPPFFTAPSTPSSWVLHVEGKVRVTEDGATQTPGAHITPPQREGGWGGSAAGLPLGLSATPSLLCPTPALPLGGPQARACPAPPPASAASPPSPLAALLPAGVIHASCLLLAGQGRQRCGRPLQRPAQTAPGTQEGLAHRAGGMTQTLAEVTRGVC